MLCAGRNIICDNPIVLGLPCEGRSTATLSAQVPANATRNCVLELHGRTEAYDACTTLHGTPGAYTFYWSLLPGNRLRCGIDSINPGGYTGESASMPAAASGENVVAATGHSAGRRVVPGGCIWSQGCTSVTPAMCHAQGCDLLLVSLVRLRPAGSVLTPSCSR